MWAWRWQRGSRLPRVQHLAERVEACWVQLGGPRIARRPEDLDDADVFLQLLARVTADEPDDLVQALSERLERLFAGSRTARIQLMTIHKAKGLEFDAVFLPGLQTGPGGNHSSLFRHREILSDDGRAGSLLAPTKPSGQSLPSLFDYLGLLAREADECEAQRLLYVAMTRARQVLGLSAVVEFRRDGEPARASGSFLGMLRESFSPVLDSLDRDVVEPANDQADEAIPLVQLADAVPALTGNRGVLEPVSLGDPAPDRARLALGEALHHWLELIHDHWNTHWLGDWYDDHARRTPIKPVTRWGTP